MLCSTSCAAAGVGVGSNSGSASAVAGTNCEPASRAARAAVVMHPRWWGSWDQRLQRPPNQGHAVAGKPDSARLARTTAASAAGATSCESRAARAAWAITDALPEPRQPRPRRGAPRAQTRRIVACSRRISSGSNPATGRDGCSLACQQISSVSRLPSPAITAWSISVAFSRPRRPRSTSANVRKSMLSASGPARGETLRRRHLHSSGSTSGHRARVLAALNAALLLIVDTAYAGCAAWRRQACTLPTLTRSHLVIATECPAYPVPLPCTAITNLCCGRT